MDGRRPDVRRLERQALYVARGRTGPVSSGPHERSQPPLSPGPDRVPDRSGWRRLRGRERSEDRRELPALRLRVPAGAAAQRAAGRPGDRLGVEDLWGGPDRRRDQRVRLAPRASWGFSSRQGVPVPPHGLRGPSPLPSAVRERAPALLSRRPLRQSSEDDASEGAAAEWESAQGAKTAQFVPDPAMLDSAPEPTPVVPLDVLKLAAGSPVRAGRGAHRHPRRRSPRRRSRSCRARRSTPSRSPRRP